MLSRFSHVRFCVTPWTATCQAPLSMRLSRQEYWSGCHALLQGIFPGIEPMSLMSAVLEDRFFTASITWEAQSIDQSLN